MMRNEIMQAISEQFHDCGYWKDSEVNSSAFWTNKIKAALESAKAGMILELRYTNRSEGNNINWEFLYDFVYLDTGKKDVGNGYFEDEHLIKRVAAIVESEFNGNPKEILYDFAKLLLGRADLKVMIFYNGSNEGSAQIISEMKRMIKAFTQSILNEEYLICWFNHDVKNFSYVLLDGKGTQLKIQ